MLTFRQIQNCEGYYFNTETREILRNVGPGETRCWSEGSWKVSKASGDLDEPQFERITADVSTSYAAVQREVGRRYGNGTSGDLVNRQTAVQPDGEVVTEEARIRLPELETGSQ